MVMCVNWENIPEIHLLNYNGNDFYDSELSVKVLKCVRKMDNISSVEELKAVIQKDVDFANSYSKSKK